MFFPWTSILRLAQDAFAQDVLDATTAIATEIHGQATGANTAPWKRILEPLSWDSWASRNLRKPNGLILASTGFYAFNCLYIIILTKF